MPKMPPVICDCGNTGPERLEKCLHKPIYKKINKRHIIAHAERAALFGAGLLQVGGWRWWQWSFLNSHIQEASPVSVHTHARTQTHLFTFTEMRSCGMYGHFDVMFFAFFNDKSSHRLLGNFCWGCRILCSARLEGKWLRIHKLVIQNVKAHTAMLQFIKKTTITLSVPQYSLITCVEFITRAM